MLEYQTFMVAERCNLSCTYCFYETGNSMYVGAKVRPDHYEEWLYKCVNSGVRLRGLSITGGEPLLRDDFVELVMVCGKFAPTMVMTNGLLLNGPSLDVIVEHDVEVHVSIDHVSPSISDRVRGGTKATVAGIRAMADAGVKRGRLVMVITSHNWRDVKEVNNLAEELGYEIEIIPVSLPQFHPLSLRSLSWEERSELVESVRGISQSSTNPALANKVIMYLRSLIVPRVTSCRCAKQGVFVNADGAVYMCALQNGGELGNIMEDNPDTILDCKYEVISRVGAGPCMSLECMAVAV